MKSAVCRLLALGLLLAFGAPLEAGWRVPQGLLLHETRRINRGERSASRSSGCALPVPAPVTAFAGCGGMARQTGDAGAVRWPGPLYHALSTSARMARRISSERVGHASMRRARS